MKNYIIRYFVLKVGKSMIIEEFIFSAFLRSSFFVRTVTVGVPGYE